MRRSRLCVFAAGAALAVGLAVPIAESASAATDPQPQDFLYVADSGSGDVSLIDTFYKTITPVGVGSGPGHVAIDPAGTRVYVTNATSDNVSVIDTATQAVTTIPVGGRPSGVAINPAGTRVYVTNTRSDNVSVIDTATHQVATTVSVGGYPTGVAVDPAGTRAYVTNFQAGSVSVIDTATNTVTATISVKPYPKSVAIAPGGTRAWVTHYGLFSSPKLVSVINTATNKVTDTVGVGDHPIDVAINPAGTRAYVANGFSDNVSVIDTATKEVTATVGVGRSPSGVAINPAGTRAYVTNNGSDNVSVIDTATNQVATTVNVGRLPIGVAVLDRPVERTAIVSLGDSYISGEAGRWQGNADPVSRQGDVWGTDRAAYSCNSSGSRCKHNGERVYGESFDDGCNRSDSAEIQSAAVAVLRRINLACSGAETINVIGERAGGKAFKGEAPQADQLRRVAKRYHVKMVVLSIGGNDLGFSSVLEKCIRRWQKQRGIEHCHVDQEPVIRDGLVRTDPEIRKTVGEIRRAMTDAGYAAGSYRLVLQSYPSPIPSGGQNRYPELGDKRWNEGGCPLFDDDSDWARDSVLPRISDMLQRIARDLDVEFLDLRDLFNGREVCSKGTRHADNSNSLENPIPGASSEWVRFLDALSHQGQKQESMHPNYYGQQSLGACLTRLYYFTGAEKDHKCTNTPDRGPEEVNLAGTSR